MRLSVHNYGGAWVPPELTEKAAETLCVSHCIGVSGNHADLLLTPLVGLGSSIVKVDIWPCASFHPILSNSLLKIHPTPVLQENKLLP